MMSSFVMASTVVLAQAGQGMLKFVKHDSVPVIVKQQSCSGGNSTLVPGHCYLASSGFDSNKKFIGSTTKVTCAAGVATLHVFEGSTNCSGTAKKPKICTCDATYEFQKVDCYSCDAAGSSKYVSPAWTNGPGVSCKSLLVPSSALLLPVKCLRLSTSLSTTISENADGTLKLVRIDEANMGKCDGPILDTATLTSGKCSSWEDAVKATVTVVATSATGAPKKNGSSSTVASVAPSFASVAMSCVATVLLAVEV